MFGFVFLARRLRSSRGFKLHRNSVVVVCPMTLASSSKHVAVLRTLLKSVGCFPGGAVRRTYFVMYTEHAE